MHRAGRIVLVDPIRQGGVVEPVARLVAHRPDHDRRMVLIALDHAAAAFQKGSLPIGVFGELIPQAMQFDVGFIDQVQAVLIAQVIPAWIVRVVTGAHGC